MPTAPPKPCGSPGCRELVYKGSRCEVHRKEQRRTQDQRRTNAQERGYGWRWQKARNVFLKSHPLCVHCQSEGIVRSATVVDHIIPHKGDKSLFWDSNNWQPLCKRHHDIKTATEDGAFGR